MHQRFIAPRAYVQGAGALTDAAQEFERLDADCAYLLGGETALDTVGNQLIDEIEAAGATVSTVAAGVDKCTYPIAEEHADRARDDGADLIVGVGGGVAQDVATAVAHRTDALLASVPTIVSTDAPCSTVAVIYDDEGNHVAVEHRDRNPDLVLVDTAVVAAAPARFLVYGMGDALATATEARAASATGAETDAGGRSSYAAVAIAEEAFDRLEAYGADALAAVERDAVTPAVERIVETNALLSGLGFESGGTAGAHAIQVGLTKAGVRRPHGELVGFGTIAELVYRDADPSTLDRALDVTFDVGLDATLDELGAADVDLRRVGEVACEHGIGVEPVEPSPARVADAVRTADELVRRRRS